MKYNDSEMRHDLKGYYRAIGCGELTPLASFELYRNTSIEINEKMVGQITANGITVTGKSDHFIPISKQIKY